MILRVGTKLTLYNVHRITWVCITLTLTLLALFLCKVVFVYLFLKISYLITCISYNSGHSIFLTLQSLSAGLMGARKAELDI